MGCRDAETNRRRRACIGALTSPRTLGVNNGLPSITQKLKLLIIDEVHLLNEERGAVIETIVARTLRQVKSSTNSNAYNPLTR
jgi:hypothetical protein